MPRLDFLKKKIEEDRVKKKRILKKTPETEESVNIQDVERIVRRMKQKYKDEGIELEEVGGRLRELRGIIAEDKTAEVHVQTVEELQEFKSPAVKKLGSFYLSLRGILEPISKLLAKFPTVKQLDFYLYSANMKYSVKQYVAITTSVAMIAFFLGLVLVTALLSLLPMPLTTKMLLVPLISIIIFLFTAVIMLLIPQRRAQMRGDEVSTELPFALRHMATELRAGIGLYRTIQAIALAGYGALSEEFARTINEIEEGTDARVALRHLALRTQSKALRNSLMHIIRALKTGGNLSRIMNDIAEDVSFELRMKMRDFAEKMNFFGVIFIFSAIVLPVMISVLGGIRNTPLQLGVENVFQKLPLGPTEIAVLYLVLMPLVMIWLLAYIKLSQPKV